MLPAETGDQRWRLFLVDGCREATGLVGGLARRAASERTRSSSAVTTSTAGMFVGLRVTMFGSSVGRLRKPSMRATGCGSVSAVVNAVIRRGGVCASKRACHIGRSRPSLAVTNQGRGSSVLPRRWTYDGAVR